MEARIPTYEYRCEKCRASTTEYRMIDQRHQAPICECGGSTRLVITGTMIRPEIPAYQSPIDGKPIESRKQRENDLKRSGSRPWEGLEQEKKEAARQIQYREQKDEAVLDRVVNEVYHQFPPSKRDLLK